MENPDRFAIKFRFVIKLGNNSLLIRHSQDRKKERGRKEGRKEGREGGKEGGRKGGKKAGREGGREEGRKGGRELFLLSYTVRQNPNSRSPFVQNY